MSSGHTKKGYTTVRAKDPKTGAIFHAAVPKNGKIAKIAAAKARKAQKEQRKQFRQFKTQLRIAKQAIPLDQRSKVAWSEVESETTLTTETEATDEQRNI